MFIETILIIIICFSMFIALIFALDLNNKFNGGNLMNKLKNKANKYVEKYADKGMDMLDKVGSKVINKYIDKGMKLANNF